MIHTIAYCKTCLPTKVTLGYVSAASVKPVDLVHEVEPPANPPHETATFTVDDAGEAWTAGATAAWIAANYGGRYA